MDPTPEPKHPKQAQMELLANSFGVNHRGEVLSQGHPEPVQASSGTTSDLIRGTVQILAYEKDQLRWTGSGTIVSDDGLILTNAHVAYPVAPGLAVLYVSLRLAQEGPPDVLVVAINETEDQPPIPRYLAELRKVDGYLDVAILEITSNLDGSPVAKSDLHLTVIPLGDSDSLHADDEVRVFGFPGAGGNTITVTQGRVSGFTPDPKIPGRGWIKTDALVTPGNSGGLAADANANLIGVPTRAPAADQGGLSQVRPINLVRPMLVSARELPVVVTPYLVSGSRKEKLEISSWLDDEIGGQLPITDYPEGTIRLAAQMAYEEMTDGEDILTIWQNELGQVSDLQQDVWKRGPKGDSLIVNLYSQQPLDDGQYLLRIFAGPTLQPIGAAVTRVGGMLLSGRVRAIGTGQPISGATVVALKPGTDAAAWATQPTQEAVSALGKSDDAGDYRMGNRVPANFEYQILVGAPGFEGRSLSLTAPAHDLSRDFALEPVGEPEAQPAGKAQHRP